MRSIRNTAAALYELLRDTYENWREDRAIRLGAGLAYYGVFAAVPLLTSAIGVAGMVFSEVQIRDFLTGSVEALLGDVSEGSTEVISSFAGTLDVASTSAGLAGIGAVVGIFGASILFVALQDALNVIWDIPVRSGFRFTIRRRALAFGVVLLTGAVLVASFAVQAVALVVDEILGGSIGEIFHLNDLLISAATWGLGWLAIAVLFQLLVEERPGWRNTFIVSALIGLLMVLGTWLVGRYFNNWGTASVSGVSGGVVVILTWFYYLAQIVIAGAELLKTLEQRSQPATRNAPQAGNGSR